MRIDALKLLAFGPFTDSVLDLSQGNQGLHLIYGNNEAGKTTALRALHSLLYGIPARTQDGFLHPYNKMRIGAVLKTADGKTLEVIRRKGKNQTLREADDSTVVDEAVLNKLLQGIDSDLFGTMFGISYQALISGGEEIVSGGGDAGSLIFSASSGIANLHEFQNALKAQAEDLFKPTGQKPKINSSLRSLKDSQKDLRDAQLTGQEWSRHDNALKKARVKKHDVGEELDNLQKELSRLKRINGALPDIARRQELVDEHHEYVDVVLLPTGFPDKRLGLQTKQANAISRKAQAETNIESCRDEIADLKITPGLIENAGQIEAFHLELGSLLKAAKDRTTLDPKRNILLGEAEEILRELRKDLSIDQAESLRIEATKVVRIKELGLEHERILARLENARDRLPELELEITQITDSLSALAMPRSIGSLQVAIAAASEHEHREQSYYEEVAEIETAEKTMAAEQNRLVLGGHTTDAIENLNIPSLETVKLYEENLGSAARRLEEIATENRNVQDKLAEVDRELEASRLEQEIPTENDLEQARELRDRGWLLIADVLEGQQPTDETIQEYLTIFSDADSLAKAFEEALSQADHVSDRLRHEADRVVSYARLIAAQTQHQKRLARLEHDLQSAVAKNETLDTGWTALWRPTGIDPRTPREMESWIREYQGLVNMIQHLRSRRAKSDLVGEHIAMHRQAVSDCLQALGELDQGASESLAGLLNRAKDTVTEEQSLLLNCAQLERDKTQKENEYKSAQSRLKTTEFELVQWQGQWESALEPIGLSKDVLPNEANAFIEGIKNLFDKLKAANGLKERIEGIDLDAVQFKEQVLSLTRVVAPELSEKEPDEAVLELHKLLKRDMEADTKRKTLEGRLAKEEKDLLDANKELDQIAAGLKVMCDEAGCGSPDELAESEKRSNHRRNLESDLKDINDRLRLLSAGATVESFIDDAKKVNPDLITGDMDRLRESIDRLNVEKSELDQEIGRCSSELKRMDGSSRAAALAEDIQSVLGRLEKDANQYARLKIAAKVLAIAIERYREKNQGPILTRASQLFHRLTCGSFQDLRADIDDSGKPVIVGVRREGKEVINVGDMSDGSADQLYLALRLAGLEIYLKENDPLPFIIDDVLIMFDDDRSVATLKVLAELSEKTQIIFFTHHNHLVDLAEQHVDSSILVKSALES